jgi:hypothetical protein
VRPCHYIHVGVYPDTARLAKNEEIRGGRVRVPGIVPDQTHQPPSHRPGDGETGQGRAGAGAAMSTSRPGWMGRGPTAAEGASSLAGGAGGAGLGYPEVARRMQEGAEVGFDATSSGSRGTAGRPGRKRTEGRGGGSLSDGEYGTKLRGERGSNSSSTRGGRGGHVAYMVHRELRDVELRLSTQVAFSTLPPHSTSQCFVRPRLLISAPPQRRRKPCMHLPGHATDRNRRATMDG